MNAAGSAKLENYRPASPPKGLRSPVRASDVSESRMPNLTPIRDQHLLEADQVRITDGERMIINRH
jgi:hypothetical protein